MMPWYLTPDSIVVIPFHEQNWGAKERSHQNVTTQAGRKLLMYCRERLRLVLATSAAKVDYRRLLATELAKCGEQRCAVSGDSDL